MFTIPGSLGIFSIGLIAGFYFARFFDANERLSTAAFVSLLAVIGVGPTALVLVQGYLQLNLLDPYGTGLAVGVTLNLLLRLLSYVLLVRASTGADGAEDGKEGQPPDRAPTPPIGAPDEPRQNAHWGPGTALNRVTSTDPGFPVAILQRILNEMRAELAALGIRVTATEEEIAALRARIR